MNSQIEELLIEQFKNNMLEAEKCNRAYYAVTGKYIDNFLPKGTGLNLSPKINGVDKSYKNLTFKKRVLQNLFSENRLLRKKELIEIVAKKEGVKADEDFITRITNSLANLTKEKEVTNYKPEGVKQKGGYWSIPRWLENGKPKPEYEIKNEMSNVG